MPGRNSRRCWPAIMARERMVHLEPQNVDMGEVGHAAPSGTVVSEFVERPHGASAAAIVRSSEPILIRPRSTGSVSIVGLPMHSVN